MNNVIQRRKKIKNMKWWPRWKDDGGGSTLRQHIITTRINTYIRCTLFVSRLNNTWNRLVRSPNSYCIIRRSEWLIKPVNISFTCYELMWHRACDIVRMKFRMNRSINRQSAGDSVKLWKTHSLPQTLKIHQINYSNFSKTTYSLVLTRFALLSLVHGIISVCFDFERIWFELC